MQKKYASILVFAARTTNRSEWDASQGMQARSRVTEPKAKAKGNSQKPKGRRLRRWGSCCEASRRPEKGIAEGRVPESEGRHGNRPDGRGSSTAGTAVRGKREEGKGKSGRLSSQNRAEADERKRKRGKSPKAKAKGKHRLSSCGSEAGKDERKQTGSRVRRTGKKGTGNRVGKNGESQRSESGRGAPGKPL